MQWLLVLKLVLLLTVANGTPVIAGKLFGNYFNRPLDCDVAFVDGRPVFGHSKTIRGIIFSLVAATITAPALGFAWTCGLVVASVAMSGDLLSSFLKRRLGLLPSSRATGLDQIPECFLPTMAIRSTLGMGALDVVSVVIIFFLGQFLLSRLFFRWNIRNRPY
jgi:CDP-archaeol synthase